MTHTLTTLASFWGLSIALTLLIATWVGIANLYITGTETLMIDFDRSMFLGMTTAALFMLENRS